MNKLKIAPLTTHTGAEIQDICLADELRTDTIQAINEALFQYGMIFFRNQQITDQQYLSFAEKMGTPRINPLTPHVEGFPAIARLIKEPWHETSTGDMWHTDHSFLPSPMNTLLRAVEVPEFGGDTLWTNTRAAFEALPEKLKEDISQLKALHSHSFLIKDRKTALKHQEEHGVAAPKKNEPPPNETFYHPVVRKHPHTAKPALFVNPGYTVKFEGWSQKQSAGMLSMIYDHCLQPEFQCRFRWAQGTIAMWDNSQTWHYAVNDYAGKRREMHRIVVG